MFPYASPSSIHRNTIATRRTDYLDKAYPTLTVVPQGALFASSDTQRWPNFSSKTTSAAQWYHADRSAHEPSPHIVSKLSNEVFWTRNQGGRLLTQNLTATTKTQNMEERRARLKATYPTFGPGKDLGADPLTIHFRKSNKVEDLEPSFSPFDATYLKTGWGEAVGTSQLPSVTHRPYPPRRQCAPVTTGLSCPCGVQRTSPNFDFSKRCNHLLKANQPQSRNAFATARVTAEDGEKGPKYLSRKGITGYLGYPRTQAFKIGTQF